MRAAVAFVALLAGACARPSNETGDEAPAPVPAAPAAPYPEISWSEARGLIDARRVSWIMLGAGRRAFLTTTERSEHITTVPEGVDVAALAAGVDPERALLAVDAHFIEHRELPWAAVRATLAGKQLFFVLQNGLRRVVIATDTEPMERYVTLQPYHGAIEKLLARDRPLKILTQHEISWRLAEDMLRQNEVSMVMEGHGLHTLLTTPAGAHYLAIAPDGEATRRLLDRVDPEGKISRGVE